MYSVFGEHNFKEICDHLAGKDEDLAAIVDSHDYPPLWVRPEGFSTLVLIILEQQVSLASAYAAFRKLKGRVGRITPEKMLSLSDEELRACYFSRQKMRYVRELAKAITARKLVLKKFSSLPEDLIRSGLKAIPGIGDWTADIYLIHALRRTDIFPIGDLALVKGIREIKNLGNKADHAEIMKIAEGWRPYRSIATMMVWHHYIRSRNMVIGD